MSDTASTTPALVEGPEIVYIEALARKLAPVAAAEQALTRPDGSPRYAAEELAERKAALQAERDALTREVIGYADEAAAEHRAVAVRLQAHLDADPLTRLTPPELARARGLAPLADDLATMGPRALADRLQAAMLRGDRAELAVLTRSAATRLAALEGTSTDHAGRHAAQEALKTAQAVLLPEELRAAPAKVAAALEQAERLANWARTAQPGYQAELIARFGI